MTMAEERPIRGILLAMIIAMIKNQGTPYAGNGLIRFS
jgi:hypothetical protein